MILEVGSDFNGIGAFDESLKRLKKPFFVYFIE